jgi:hypothetical protein
MRRTSPQRAIGILASLLLASLELLRLGASDGCTTGRVGTVRRGEAVKALFRGSGRGRHDVVTNGYAHFDIFLCYICFILMLMLQ